MPRSAVAKGNYYKSRTKKWLEAKGWQVGFLEQLKRIWTPRGVIFKKQDQFGSDLLAVADAGVIFVQVKLGTKNIAIAKKEFAQFSFPPSAELWIVVWEKRARQPVIYAQSGTSGWVKLEE